MYSIKAASLATGLTVETLRAWERRYAVVVPHRDDSGRRTYRSEDVTRLRRLKEATDRGHPIGRIARLNDEELAALLNEVQAPREASTKMLVARMLDAAQLYQTVNCDQPLAVATALLPPAQLISEVLQPLLREVGDRWHRGAFSVAQERLVSNAVRRHVGLALDSHDRNARGAPIVFATLPGERHELGLLMCAFLCASRGYKIHYLGPDVPVEDLARYAREVSASVIALSVILRDTLASVPEHLRRLAHHVEAGTTIWLGGSASSRLSREALPTGCVVIPDQLDLERRLDLLQAA